MTTDKRSGCIGSTVGANVMKFLKGLLLSILSLLLFFSISMIGLAYTLDRTLLNPDFINNAVDELDASEVFTEIVSPQLPSDQAYIGEAFSNTIDEMEPQLKEEVHQAVYRSYDFFRRDSEKLSFSISLAALKESLRDNLWQEFQNPLPPELEGMPPETRQRYFDQLYDQVSADIPDEYTIDQSDLDTDTMSLLLQIRQYVSFYQTGFILLIVFALLMAAGIILIQRNVRASTRHLGIDLTIYGVIGFVIGYVSDYLMDNFLMPYVASNDTPESLMDWLMNVNSALTTPFWTFSIIIGVIGIILLVFSFLYRRESTEAEM
jgi:hypothetical protein